MTPEEREKMINEIKITIGVGAVRGFNYRYIAEQVIAVAERRIREDCAEIVAYKAEPLGANCPAPCHVSYSYGRHDSRAAILASIPKKNPRKLGSLHSYREEMVASIQQTLDEEE